MSLPPLPLIDGCLFIDNSSLEALMSCPRAFQHSRLDKRILAGGQPALDFGSAIHKALEWRYRNCKNSPPTIVDEEAQGDILRKWFEENPVAEDEKRNLNHANEIIRRYNIKYNLEPFNVLTDADGQPLVELSFALPLFKFRRTFPSPDKENLLPESIPVIYTGRIDLPVMWDNQLIILDHKTSGMFFGPQRFLDEQKCSNQYLGYCWAFEQLTGKHVDGFCTNGIPTKECPAKPKQGIDGWWNEWFCRDITYLALYPNCLERWKSDAIALVESMFWHYQRGEFPQWGRFTRQCANFGGCQYKEVCFNPNKNNNLLQDPVIFKDNTWSPLHEVETTTKSNQTP